MQIDYKSALDNEPQLQQGVVAALVLASQKGLIDQTGVVRSYAPPPGSKPTSIPPQAYIVDDKIVYVTTFLYSMRYFLGEIFR